MSLNNKHTHRLINSARTDILAAALGPKCLHIISMHKKETQLTVKPQSKARYLAENSSLLAKRFMTITLIKNNEITRLGTFLSKSFMSSSSFFNLFIFISFGFNILQAGYRTRTAWRSVTTH